MQSIQKEKERLENELTKVRKSLSDEVEQVRRDLHDQSALNDQMEQDLKRVKADLET